MSNDQRIEVQVAANVGQLQSGMQQAVASVHTAASSIQGGLGKMEGLAGAIGGAFGTLGAILAGGAMFKACLGETLKWNGEAMKLSRTLGITTEAASILNVALGDIYTDTETYLGATRMMTRQINSGGEGFKKLGIDVRDTNGHLKPTGDLMSEVLGKLNNLKAGTDRNAAGVAIFGRSWGEASKLLRLNAEVMAEAKEKAERLHLVVGPEGVAMTKAYKAAMNDVGDVMTSLKVQVGSAVLPALTKLGAFMGDIGPGLAKTLEYAIKGVTQVFLLLKAIVETLTIAVTAGIASMIEGWKTVGLVVYNVVKGNFSEAQRLAKEGAQNIKNELVAAGEGIADSWKSFAKESKDLWTDKMPAKKGGPEESSATFDPDKAAKTSPFEAISKAWDRQKALLISKGAEASEYGKAAELAYWESKLSALKKGSEDWVKATLKTEDLRKQIDDEAKAANKKMEEEAAKHGAKMVDLAQTRARGEAEAALIALDAEADALARRAQLGEISAQEELTALQELERRRYEIKMQGLEQSLEVESDVVRRQEILSQLEQLELEHQQRIKNIQGQALVEQQQQVTGFLQPLTQAFNSSLEGLLAGTMSWAGAMSNVWKGLGSMVDQAIAQMATTWVAGQMRMLAVFVMNKAKEVMVHRAAETGKTAATGQSVLARVALETWGAIKSVALAIWTGLKWVAIQAYKAAAGAYSAIVSIPYVGPFLAPVAAGVALAAVIGMSSKLMSAAGGYDIPAGVNPLVQTHAQEMVLPAKISNGFRNVFQELEGGGRSGGGGDVYHFSAQFMDARGGEDFLRRHQGGLVKIMKDAARNGRIG